MDTKNSSLCTNKRHKTGTFQRILSFVLAWILLLNALSPAVQAAWDGGGSTDDDDALPVTGETWLRYTAGEDNLAGYRFSVYTESGTKVGYSVDYLREADDVRFYYADVYRSIGNKRQSHIDLNRKYQLYGYANIDVDKYAFNGKDDADAKMYYDPNLPTTSSVLGTTWLTSTKAKEVAKLCGCSEWDGSKYYMVVEPLYFALLVGDYYCMTLAEFAVYQSTQYGWEDSHAEYPMAQGDLSMNGDNYTTVIRFLSGVYGRHLYAEKHYDVLGTKVPGDRDFKKDGKDTESVLFGASTVANTAADVLNYQIGMGIYTDIEPQYRLTIYTHGGSYDGIILCMPADSERLRECGIEILNIE